ncbi:MAG: hypothetical protein Q9195_007623 [Heterodermia aff. obscurata]
MSPTKRLTRSAPDSVKTQEFASRQQQSQAAGARKSGIGKELAALEIDAVGGKTQLPSTKANRRYELRGKGKNPLLAPKKPARVTKSKSTGRKKKAEKKKYRGPGYQEWTVSEGMGGEERECLICAQELNVYVLFLWICGREKLSDDDDDME